jgi:hypothetical protein
MSVEHEKHTVRKKRYKTKCVGGNSEKNGTGELQYRFLYLSPVTKNDTATSSLILEGKASVPHQGITSLYSIGYHIM